MFGSARSFWPVDMFRTNITHFTNISLLFDARQLTGNTHVLHFFDTYLHTSIGLSIYRPIYIPVGRVIDLSIYLSICLASCRYYTVQPFGASEGGTLIRHQQTGRGADAPLRVLTLPHLQNARRFLISLSHREGSLAGG